MHIDNDRYYISINLLPRLVYKNAKKITLIIKQLYLIIFQTNSPSFPANYYLTIGNSKFIKYETFSSANNLSNQASNHQTPQSFVRTYCLPCKISHPFTKVNPHVLSTYKLLLEDFNINNKAS